MHVCVCVILFLARMNLCMTPLIAQPREPSVCSRCSIHLKCSYEELCVMLKISRWIKKPHTQEAPFACVWRMTLNLHHTDFVVTTTTTGRWCRWRDQVVAPLNLAEVTLTLRRKGHSTSWGCCCSFELQSSIRWGRLVVQAFLLVKLSFFGWSDDKGYLEIDRTTLGGHVCKRIWYSVPAMITRW